MFVSAEMCADSIRTTPCALVEVALPQLRVYSMWVEGRTPNAQLRVAFLCCVICWDLEFSQWIVGI